MKTRCPVCEGAEFEGYGGLYDDRYGYGGVFHLRGCASCGHKFIEESFTPDEIGRLYTEFYPRSSFKLEDYRPKKERKGFLAWLDGAGYEAFRWVPARVRVLDIGCGFGETLGYFKARGCEAWGVEADRNIIRVAEKYGLNVRPGVFDPTLFEKDFFDYAVMDQVIEHVSEPVHTLKGVAGVLKPGGRAVLSLPNPNGWGAKVFGKKWIHWHAPYHLQHFSVQSMRLAAAAAGLTVESFSTVTNSNWLCLQFIHLATRPAEGEPSGFWSPRGEKTLWVAGIRIFFFAAVSLTKIGHAVTRLFDALKRGDNFIFVLKKGA
ncbi:MAG: class I SAM-dependent methyltransferase [Deltaproteobacteria bacterium]|nr:class I SAM-dependent methyltransferase [Deltaproteobacteria bacterium]